MSYPCFAEPLCSSGGRTLDALLVYVAPHSSDDSPLQDDIVRFTFTPSSGLRSSMRGLMSSMRGFR